MPWPLIWHEKPITAKKALSRLRTVFKYARAKGFLVNRAVIEEAVILLGDNKKPAKQSLALPWSEVPAFYATLSDDDPAQLALRLLILTGARADSVNNMLLGQIEGPFWQIPPLHVKGRASNTAGFDVPLSREALHVIALAKKQEQNGYLFPNLRGGCRFPHGSEPVFPLGSEPPLSYVSGVRLWSMYDCSPSSSAPLWLSWL